MKIGSLVRCGCLVAAAAVAVLVSPAASSSQTSQTVRIVSSRQNVQVSAMARPISTQELEAAEPLPVPVRDTFSGDRTWRGPRSEATGRPGFIRGGEGLEHDLGPSVRALAPAAIASLDTDPPSAYSYPPPYNRYELFPSGNAPYKLYPYRTVGVLFFRIPGRNGVFRCSASSIGNYAVWTAGHCVVEPTGLVHTDFVFWPAARNLHNQRAYGSFAGAYAIYPDAWATRGDYRYDFGMVILRKNTVDGVTAKISERVGWLSFAWNQPVTSSDAHWAIVGYPLDFPFDGTTQQICQSSFAYYDTIEESEMPLPVGVGCDQAGGSSGGPWIRRFSGSTTDGNYLNGNVSYRLIVDGERRIHELFSPYLDDVAKAAYDCAVNSSPEVYSCVGPPQP